MKPTSYNKNAHPRAPKPADYACSSCNNDATGFHNANTWHGSPTYTAYCAACLETARNASVRR